MCLYKSLPEWSPVNFLTNLLDCVGGHRVTPELKDTVANGVRCHYEVSVALALKSPEDEIVYDPYFSLLEVSL